MIIFLFFSLNQFKIKLFSKLIFCAKKCFHFIHFNFLQIDVTKHWILKLVYILYLYSYYKYQANSSIFQNAPLTLVFKILFDCYSDVVWQQVLEYEVIFLFLDVLVVFLFLLFIWIVVQNSFKRNQNFDIGHQILDALVEVIFDQLSMISVTNWLYKFYFSIFDPKKLFVWILSFLYVCFGFLLFYRNCHFHWCS